MKSRAQSRLRLWRRSAPWTQSRASTVQSCSRRYLSTAWILFWLTALSITGSCLFSTRFKKQPEQLSEDLKFVEPYCQNRARKLQETYAAEYKIRHRELDPNGPSYAYYRWNGTISKLDFQGTLATHHAVLTVKIMNNKLYERGNWNRKASEMLTIPDVDVSFFLDDEPICNLPFIYYSIDIRCGSRSGFTMPSYDVFKFAFGPKQMRQYMSCLDRNLPLNRKRIMKAIWRGSSTGDKSLSIATIEQSHRIHLVSLLHSRPDILDVGITQYVQLDEGDDEILQFLKEVAPLKAFMLLDDFNKYGVILDVDGNSWSDRFSKLLMFNTPILKQQSPWKEYFAHQAERQSLVVTFERNLSDLIPKVEQTLEQYRLRSNLVAKCFLPYGWNLLSSDTIDDRVLFFNGWAPSVSSQLLYLTSLQSVYLFDSLHQHKSYLQLSRVYKIVFKSSPTEKY